MNAPQAVRDPSRHRSIQEMEAGTCGWSTVLLMERRPLIRSGLTQELRGLRMEPIPIGPDLSGTGLLPLEEGAGRSRPLLIADAEGAKRSIELIRRSGHRNPIIAYQDFRRSDRAVDLLEAGADQVLTLPLRGVELQARITMILRRAHGVAGGQVRTGPLIIPFDRRPATLFDDPVALPEAEATLLRHLAMNLDRPVSRDRLYELLYETSEAKPYLRILDRYICNLRRRISDRWPEGATRIRTLTGYGYTLLGDARPA